jgi:murein DD-endopeptidase MepM/ murein hydrolase activator NlpD
MIKKLFLLLTLLFTIILFSFSFGLNIDSAPTIKFICPVDSGIIISDYGPRMHPILKEIKEHKGIDIKTKIGSNVYSSSAGLVVFTGDKEGYGKSIIIKHKEGYSTFYAHLQKILVKKGQQVETGTLIGLVGKTGLTTVPNLHFEIRKNNDSINPHDILQFGNKIKIIKSK